MIANIYQMQSKRGVRPDILNPNIQLKGKTPKRLKRIPERRRLLPVPLCVFKCDP